MAKKIKVTRFSAAGEPSPNSGKRALIVIGVILLLLAGFTLGKLTASKSSDTSKINNERKSSIGDVNSSNERKTKGIVPVGFEQSSKGAVDAAVSYVALIPKLYFTSEQIMKLSAVQFTTPAYTQGFLEAIAANRASARNVYKADPDAFLREVPLSFFVGSETDTEVKVIVWTAVMLAARPDFDGKTESRLHAIDLVWENNDWKVKDWQTTTGPTPRWQATESSLMTVEEFVEFIKPFKGGFDYVPSF